jgi:hypothetical protein
MIVTPEGKVRALIDWEAGGFYPYGWIATKPSLSPGLDFYPSIEGAEDFEWRKRLKEKLMGLGFAVCSAEYVEWREA